MDGDGRGDVERLAALVLLRRGDDVDRTVPRRAEPDRPPAARRVGRRDRLARGADFTLGLQTRRDDIRRVGLYTTTARQRWGSVARDSVRQGSLGLYGEATVQWLEKLRSVAGLRADRHRFDVTADTPANSGQVDAALASPKLALILGPWARTEVYLNFGHGFHSNDARGITLTTQPDFRDPAFGTPAHASTPLVRTKGSEIGVRSALLPGLHSSLALWQLDIASELVFTGDAGTTEARFPSRRRGIGAGAPASPATASAPATAFAWPAAQCATGVCPGVRSG